MNRPIDRDAEAPGATALHRRRFLQAAGALAAAAPMTAAAQDRAAETSTAAPAKPAAAGLHKGMMSYMVAHEQFPVPELVKIGAAASAAGFDVLSNSDHFQPWQDNEAHAGLAWVTMAATGAQAPSAWMGTTVTCPTFRYNPAVVAEAFASLSLLYPGRIFLGVGSGEALNEQSATGNWPRWRERWDRLIEAIGVIRALWEGQQVHHKGRFFSVDARLYDKPASPIPLLTAANGPKAMRLAGQHGDGLITDPETWEKSKSEWEAGARAAGKDPASMPVLIEQFVVVGGDAEIKQSAESWRFIPKAFKGYQDIRDPAAIRQRAEAELTVEKVSKGWVTGTDPAAHIKKIEKLFASGATIVNIHAGQSDQMRAIDFYGKEVLPKLKRG